MKRALLTSTVGLLLIACSSTQSQGASTPSDTQQPEIPAASEVATLLERADAEVRDAVESSFGPGGLSEDKRRLVVMITTIIALSPYYTEAAKPNDEELLLLLGRFPNGLTESVASLLRSL